MKNPKPTTKPKKIGHLHVDLYNDNKDPMVVDYACEHKQALIHAGCHALLLLTANEKLPMDLIFKAMAIAVKVHEDRIQSENKVIVPDNKLIIPGGK